MRQTQQQLFDFDALEAPKQQPSHGLVTREEEPTVELTRPDRQLLYPDAVTHYDWPSPDSLHDRDTITVDRVSDQPNEPAHRFVIKRGDTVAAFFSKDKTETGQVVGISHAKNQVSVRFGEGSSGIWFNTGQIYPAAEPARPPKNGKPLSAIIEDLNGKHGPPAGFAPEDGVPREQQNGTAPKKQDLGAEISNYLDNLGGGEVHLRVLRSELGHPDVDQANPETNPVHAALKLLRDAGKVHVTNPRFGEPQVSKLQLPDSPDGWNSFQPPSELSGPEIVHFMRRYNVTIDDLSARTQITKNRIRTVRERGVEGRHTVRDWLEAIARPPIEGGAFTLDDHRAFRERAKEGNITADEWKIEFERMLASRSEFLAELQQTYNAKQLKNLAGNLGNFGAGQNSKAENARSAYRSLLAFFHIGGGYQFDPMRETPEAALAREVRGITQDKLDDYYQERGVERAAHEKATTNPESLDEFRTFIRFKGEGELTEDQVTRYDTLQAIASRERRASETKTTVQHITSDGAEGLELNIIEGYHSKRECPVWVVQLSERVDRATFNELKAKAKQLGGWFSSFVKSQSGFQFLEVDSARKFASLLQGDADRTEELAARKERKEQTAAERLTRLAADLHARAEDTIERSKESLQNTARRADIQAGIRGRAYGDQALARTLTGVAAALETGAATFLDGIRHKTHVETLQRTLHLAKWKRILQIRKAKSENEYGYGMRVQEEEAKPYCNEDIRFARYPNPSVYKGHLEEAVAATSRAKGVKMAAERMRKRIKGVKEDFVDFTTEHDVGELTDFLGRVKGAGHNTEWMDREVDSWKRVRAANIHTLPELRSALRELVPLLSAAEGDDPVAIAERELIGKDLPGFFPTPKSLVERLIQEAELEPHHRVLEPSCGKGDIAHGIRTAEPEAFLTAVEMNRTLADVLTARGFDPVFGDFLQFHDPLGFDRVLMNPPFERGTDIDHVQHAYQLLRPGGRIAAIMSEGPFFRSDRKSEEFRNWLDEVGGTSEELPPDSFKGIEAFRETSVRTRLVLIGREDD